MSDNVRKLVEDVLSPHMTREVWSGNFHKALPVSLQPFELSEILPAVFYMFRFGNRKGKGKGRFLDTFGSGAGTPSQRRRSATIERVAESLAATDDLKGFDDEVERAILGDLLLCFCLENVRHDLGRDKQVQRVAPTHYMASWVDLPPHVTNLRFVPEMIVAMLAGQDGGHVDRSGNQERSWFAVGERYEDNVLLRAFDQGVTRGGDDLLASRTSDRFDEKFPVGLDQLLTIRLAQRLGEAPDKVRGKDAGPISNQRPIAESAARDFADDMRRFVRAFADPAPRHALVEMLESCIAVGLTTILTSTVDILFRWAETGAVPNRRTQRPAPLFVDCANGVDPRIRARAEQSMDDVMRRMERFSVVLMVLRLLDYQAGTNRKIKKQNVSTRPYATEWINLLGDLLHRRHEQAQRIHDSLEEKAENLAEKLEGDYPETARILDDDASQPNAVWRLAEGLMALMGPKFARDNFMKMIDSSLLTGRPNGLAAKRTERRSVRSGGAEMIRRREVRRVVFTNAVLDYLVHLHLLPTGNKWGVRVLSLGRFIEVIRERYGFHVDAAPPGMTISNDLLRRNRATLERRLRDLGLLVGVNDAEAMKRLRPRFKPAGEN